MNDDNTLQREGAIAPLSDEAVTEFQNIWAQVTGDEIDLQTAKDYGQQLLALFNFIYKHDSNNECNHQAADKTAKEGNHGQLS